jgi:2-keto-myo-inositol isomerase
MTAPFEFALNHAVAPALGAEQFCDLAESVGIAAVELRNDLDSLAPSRPPPRPVDVGAHAAARGMRVLTLNALGDFDRWSPQRAEEAAEAADVARRSGAAALVLAPVWDAEDRRTAGERDADLRAALVGLAPILEARGLLGLVEPLGFPTCSLRSKRAALEAIDGAGVGDHFLLVHDTFHHRLAGEPELFPQRTGIVHVSGVDDRDVPVGQLSDERRVLVGPGDVLDTKGQVDALRRGGYTGPISFEPFSPAVHGSRELGPELARSIAYLST